MIRFQRIACLVLGAATLAAPVPGYAKKRPPPVVVAPPPPPPTPMRPIPPQGAVMTMFIPPADALGVRQTVNTNLTPAQMTWNLRSALNVAALNCLEPQHEPILNAYKALLKKNAKSLTATSRTVDREFRDKYGTTYQVQRDAYNTQVYNYFALPPARAAFCDAAVTISNEMLQTPPTDLNVLSAQMLPRLEQVFEGFYRSFEQFRLDAAAWDAKFGRYFGYTLPQAAALTPAGIEVGAPTPAPSTAVGEPLLVVPQPAASTTQPVAGPAPMPMAIASPSPFTAMGEPIPTGPQPAAAAPQPAAAPAPAPSATAPMPTAVAAPGAPAPVASPVTSAAAPPEGG